MIMKSYHSTMSSPKLSSLDSNDLITNYRKSIENEIREPDTCRICRGEGDVSESLFYPCKCSGSIKYVHQGCLMEWLSHSQKKHCELCKTAFRFTKLYSPDMPKSLPLYVLARYAFFHALKTMKNWLRFCLVTVVWLGILPYTIRQFWRLLFWISDGRWPSSYWDYKSDKTSSVLKAIQSAYGAEFTRLMANGTCPIMPFSSNPTNPASLGNVINKLNEVSTSIFQTINISGSTDATSKLLNSAHHGLKIQSLPEPEKFIDKNIISEYIAKVSARTKGASLMSEISLFQNLTRNTSINQLVLNVVEGYIITVLVVISFILIFLIREWVVQQQPGLNIGAGFNAEPAVVPEEIDNEWRDQLQQNEMEADNNQTDGRSAPADLMTVGVNINDQNETDMNGFAHGPGSHNSQIEVSKRTITQPLKAEEFMEVWRRGSRNPDEVLKLIEKEGKLGELEYWVKLLEMQRNPVIKTTPAQPNMPVLANKCREITPLEDFGNTIEHSLPINPDSHLNTAGIFGDGSKLYDSKRLSHLSNHSYSLETSDPGDRGESNKLKGKERACDSNETICVNENYLKPKESDSEDPSTEDSLLSILISEADTNLATSSRPRSTSDGPVRKRPSLLSTNNWIFPEMSEEQKEGSFMSYSLEPLKNIGHPDYSNNSSPESINNPSEEIKQELNEKIVSTDSNDSSPRIYHKKNDVDMLELETAILTPRPTHFEELSTTTYMTSSVNEDKETEVNQSEEIPTNHSNHNLESDQRPIESNPPTVNSHATDNTLFEARAPDTIRPAPDFLGTVAEFLWGGIGDDVPAEELIANEELIIHDIAAEPPFVPVARHDALNPRENAVAVREEAQDAIAVGNDQNDPEAIDDAEDFEGIMELIGMRGPIFSLLQNALFSALLLGLTVTVGVWTPYNFGKISLLLIANPGPALKAPLKILFGCAALMQDLALSVFGVLSLLIIQLFAVPYSLGITYFGLGESPIASQASFVASMIPEVSSAALIRIKESALRNMIHITDSEMSIFSAACHESLHTIRNSIVGLIKGLLYYIGYAFYGDYHITSSNILLSFQTLSKSGFQTLLRLPHWFVKSDIWMINLAGRERSAPIDVELSVWNGTDRFCAILVGYSVLCILGALYVRRGSPFSSGQVGRELEMALMDLLNQAGGVVKVILIISIEMLIFPLYCGLLLDFALLPLFENTSILSRFLFTLKSPLTSIFVHWFVGTCYMFHFALFVSMCRKIMRKGVLYFIRDPDDPTFHPVRDVLERNVTTQLQKILFSALVYGGLVIVCLGGVVWGISYTFTGILPIHWSSNKPVLEFPIDLLFYNFFMPMAIKLFKPSHALRTMYDWWFRQCARMLRLTWFMFDERRLDEEGHLVRKTWKDVFWNSKGDPFLMVMTDDSKSVFENNPQWRAYYRRDGKYVRAPASDQVRIPKGSSIFLEVDEMNNRIDGKTDQGDGIHGKNSMLCKQVYIPPWFRLRIVMFILSIWLFAAVTGVGITIVPLVLGRMVFSTLIPDHVHKNDAYAFSIGIYLLGSIVYCTSHLKNSFLHAYKVLVTEAYSFKKILQYVFYASFRIISVIWTYAAFLLVFPTLFALLIELYFIVPLHTYFAMGERHVIYFVQSWTLGLLYVKLTTRLILWNENSRPAQSLRAIIRNGYLNPDARLATRSFILPGAILLSSAFSIPWALARLIISTMLRNSPDKHTLTYRYSYPVFLCLCGMALILWIMMGWARNWKLKIRDDVYLIGERLHNFGDRKVQNLAGAHALRRIDA
ncbi:BgTH12-00894 [Blumeria graminis f. sp. triticale]|uniref:RING-type E3 ubiquitin transferase n=1 Tax=Blumeria graminis f. sp. triticale TaxID=1689686 RepID=A0A9W4GHZ2_BLUGR|nr:BgTH12-00894 [Blumeria graminis f. sp. triticale]